MPPAVSASSSQSVVEDGDPAGLVTTTVEAGAAGLPQIVPDQGGTAELVIPETTGLHYDVDDPER